MGCVVAAAVYGAAVVTGQTTVGIFPIAVMIAVASVWGSYFASDKIVLTMTGAREIDQ